MKKYAIILAAGKGTRMKTDLPKCAYPLLKKPMIVYIIENLTKSQSVDEIITVVGHKKEVIKNILNSRVSYADQDQQLGTGHAVLMAKDLVKEEGYSIILPGDMPLIDDLVIKEAMAYHESTRNDLTVVSTFVDEPDGYGRIIMKNEQLQAIVEEKDASEQEKEIKEINTGIYIVDNQMLFEGLNLISDNNAQHEYYLTDIVKVFKSQKKRISTFILKKPFKAMGINDLYALSQAEAILRHNINKEIMRSGVAMINPDTITIGDNVVIEENVTISPNCYITGNSHIKKNTFIGPSTEIHNSIIGENVKIQHSLIFNSEVKDNTTVGPFAHLRDGAIIGTKNRIGNFVEIKKTITGDNFKASHLAYLGDAEVGNNVNFGCGSITVNYDGTNKYKTLIGDDVFVGCNANLIAPIQIEDNSTIAAGSTLNKNVPKDSLAIARSYQVNKENYFKNKSKSNGKK
ncbi:MAG: bifunctional UDP-N-acetylglucosamine diphosphorylase/glucosamine-1-phosphate N-acetyltransferase GlmU [Candidatus Izemoplasmatales bacterium]|uniref:Bifunctional protein GlmU n=1 Tax=Hujiaoplasma nucleasis TaxID=2725268 RepID=A0A7L6N393_9MOLU|nr:bifunctional UDP-N-acetylglucosamine diphosphorylase/glucosamine-1-phosphate N-acetyltransferase GlmU [Hujiaoplasma nucleasis]QLY39707.1 bifunctional UDP-N-acetylglucosamine diphosphorylase/glucosamine-1-phosphate N-acetyltransferase GlmU [Hujiaoplasma nucleasis]